MMDQATPPKMPRDAAQIVVWFKGLPQPTAFLVTREVAEEKMQQYLNGSVDVVYFTSYPDGRGMRSQSAFAVADLRGLTIEYPTIQIVGE